MAAPKGHEKKGGRSKGTPNKKTEETLRRIESVMSKLEDTIEADIESLPAHERVRLWKDLQEYIRPKLQRVEMNAQVEQKLTIKVKLPDAG